MQNTHNLAQVWSSPKEKWIISFIISSSFHVKSAMMICITFWIKVFHISESTAPSFGQDYEKGKVPEILMLDERRFLDTFLHMLDISQ